MREAKLAAASALALSLMRRWGLTGRDPARYRVEDWQFRFNRRKRGMGRCVYPKPGQPGRIELSSHYVLGDNPVESLRDTVLHEIAHALAGAAAGHGPSWREACLRVGARPERCGEADMPVGPWRADCPCCGKSYAMHRRPKHLARGGYYCVRPGCGKVRGSLSFRKVGG